MAVNFSIPRAQGAESAEDVMKKSQRAFLYAGSDMKTRVMMRLIAKDGRERIREMTMLRKNTGEAGDQKYFIYFNQPADVRNMTFLAWKHPKKETDRWLFIPALNMVRKVAASDTRSSFVGSDFSYEDISGRDTDYDTHTLVKDEKAGDRDCYVVKSAPKDERGMDYTYKLSWIDRERWLPLKEEYYGRTGSIQKAFTADEVKNIGGYWTVTRRTMKNLENGHRTEVSYEKTEYNKNMEDSLFTERSLKNPSGKWIE